MKKGFKILLIVFGIIVTVITIIIAIGLFIFLKDDLEPAEFVTARDKETINSMVKELHPSYIIYNMKLQYSDWSSTVREVDKYDKPDSAEVSIKNDDEQRTMYLRKKGAKWYIVVDEADYGNNVPNDVYFLDYESKTFDINYDIEHSSYWLMPDDSGNYYVKETNGKKQFYSAYICNDIYKTKDGIIYKFNKDKNVWEKTKIEYSYLCYYDNYKVYDKEYVMNLLEKYTSYKEK